jgi:hypothetical protein
MPGSPLFANQHSCNLTSTLNWNPDGSPYVFSGTGAGWEGEAAIGSSAMQHFTPPPGTRLHRVRASQHIVVGGDGWGPAAVWTAAGRPLNDISRHLAGLREDTVKMIDYGPAELGADGAAGIRWGSTCPQPVDPIATWCSGSQILLTKMLLDIDDLTPPELRADAQVDPVTGAAVVSWQARDEQSGIRTIVIAVDGAEDVEHHPAVPGQLRPYAEAANGSRSFTVPVGRQITVVVTAENAGLDPTTETFTLNGPVTAPPIQSPQPPGGGPTPPPYIPPYTPPSTQPRPPSSGNNGTKEPVVKRRPRVTLKAKRSGRRLTISGTARGCTRVTIKAAGRTLRPRTAKRSGKWSARIKTKTTRKAKITVRCSSAKRSTRR